MISTRVIVVYSLLVAVVFLLGMWVGAALVQKQCDKIMEAY